MGGLWGWGGGFNDNFILKVMEHWLKVWIFFLFIVCFEHNIRFECFFGFRVWRVGGGSNLLVFFCVVRLCKWEACHLFPFFPYPFSLGSFKSIIFIFHIPFHLGVSSPSFLLQAPFNLFSLIFE
jgi:hypothetical protein